MNVGATAPTFSPFRPAWVQTAAAEPTHSGEKPDSSSFSPQALNLMDHSKPLTPQESRRLQHLPGELKKLGIHWDGKHEGASDRDALTALSTLRDVARAVPPGKRGPQLTVHFEQQLPPGVLCGVMAEYREKSHDLILYGPQIANSHGEADRDGFVGTVAHEYGHHVENANRRPGDPADYAHVRDKRGHDLFKASEKLGPRYDPLVSSHLGRVYLLEGGKKRDLTPEQLQEFMKRRGLSPEQVEHAMQGGDFPEVMKRAGVNPDEFPDLFAQTMHSSRPVMEKYAGNSAEEHYAETFREFTTNPQRFKDRIQQAEAQARAHPGDPNLQEQARILRESWNYFASMGISHIKSRHRVAQNQ